MTEHNQPKRHAEGNVSAPSSQTPQMIRSAKVTTREDIRRDTYTASRDSTAAASRRA
jgi:hypothetical protein